MPAAALLIAACLASLVAAGAATATEPAPALARTVVAIPVSGAVLVREPRSTVFVPLTTRRVIPVGSTIDTTRGKLALLAAGGAPGSMQSGTFDGGAFTVTQDRFALTNLLLVGERPRAQVCGAHGSGALASTARLSSVVLGLLRASVRGRFRTEGRYAAATVRGTEWTTVDECDGTSISDQQGDVVTAARGAPLSRLITPGLTIEYRCQSSGMRPVSSSYCIYLLGLDVPGVPGGPAGVPAVPALELFTGELVTKSSSDRADLCVRDPAQRLSCTTYPLTPPAASGFRQGGEVCYADHGVGEYRVSFRIAGVTLGAPLTYHAPARGQAGLCGSSLGAFYPGPLTGGPAPSSTGIAADQKLVSRYLLPTAGRLIGMVIDLGPTATAGEQQLTGVLYAGAGGNPGALIATTNTLTFRSSEPSDAYVMNFPQPVTLTPGEYWIGVLTGGQSDVAGFRYQLAPGSEDSGANPFAAGASKAFGQFAVGNERLILDVDYDLVNS
jgi:hypothetical protein